MDYQMKPIDYQKILLEAEMQCHLDVLFVCNKESDKFKKAEILLGSCIRNYFCDYIDADEKWLIKQMALRIAVLKDKQG